MSPLRRRRLWHWVPLLLVGVGALALLPAGQSSINHVDTVAKPTASATVAAAIAPPAAAAEPKLAATTPPPSPSPVPAPGAPANPNISQVAAIAPVTPDTSAGPAAPAGALPSTAQLSATATATTTDATTQQSLPDGLTDGRIGASAVNVRSGPSSDTDKRFVIQPGESIKVGETNGSWVHIYREDGSDGWVFGRYIAGHEPAPAADPTPPPTRAATADANFEPPPNNLVGRYGEAHSLITARTGPSGGSPPAFLLQPGDRFRISQSHRGWILIVTDDGMSGWIVA